MSNPLYELVQDEPPDALVPAPPKLAAVPMGCLLDVLGMRLTDIGRGRSRVEMTITATHLNQRGIPQGGALVALADAAAGWASYAAVPSGQFTTVDLSCKLLGRTEVGAMLVATASPVHLGRRTVALDVAIAPARPAESDSPPRLVARFSCTQLVLQA